MGKSVSAAIITVKNIPDMDDAGKESIVEWIRKQADFIAETPSDVFSSRFVARYLYREE